MRGSDEPSPTPARAPGSPPGEEGASAPGWPVAATIAYLFLPVVIFVVGWLRPAWALLCLTGLTYTVRDLTFRVPRGLAARGSRRTGTRWHAALTMLVLVVVAGFSGAGGFGFQTWDWEKHNAILKDLTDRPWPVTYHVSKLPLALTYYVAYYLPAATAGKLMGWTAANVVLDLWTILGVCLTVSWMRLLAGARWGTALVLFLAFSGFDVVGALLTGKPADPFGKMDLEWWAMLWEYPSNLSLLIYVPHHAISAWLFTAVLIAGTRREAGAFPAIGLLVATILWSPLVTVGLGALLAARLAGDRGLWRAWRRAGWQLGDLGAIPLGLVLVLYFASRIGTPPLPPDLESPPAVIRNGTLAVLVRYFPVWIFLTKYTVFVMLEFGLVAAALLAASRWGARSDRRLFLAACAVLLVLPWFHYGQFNDLVMRACIPSLFVLQIAILLRLEGAASPEGSGDTSSGRSRQVLLGLLAIGALAPANTLRGFVNRTRLRPGPVIQVPDHDRIPGLFLQQRRIRTRIAFLQQYVGSSRSFFFERIGRRPEAASPVRHAVRRSGVLGHDAAEDVE